jgi:ankyrin repeat protein
MNRWLFFSLVLFKGTILMGSNGEIAKLSKRYPLHEASHAGDTKVVQQLLDSKANPNELNAQGFTPLMVAHACAVEPLLNAKADPAVVDPKRWLTPLMIASYNVDQKKVDLLLKSNQALPKATTNEGMTALHFVALAACENDKGWSRKKKKEVKKTTNEKGRTAKKLVSIARSLEKWGAVKNVFDREGKMPINYLHPDKFHRPWNKGLVPLLKNSESA